MKISIEKFHAALNVATALVIAKREAGYANDLEKFAGDAAETALSSVFSQKDYEDLPIQMQALIFNVLHQAGKIDEAGLLNSINLGLTTVAHE